MNKRPLCPKCAQKMVFAPDGRGLLCERCGYRHVVARELPSAKELSRAQKLLNIYTRADAEKETSLRISLRQGIGAVKEKDYDEAFSHLKRVILSPDASGETRAEAWFWLSEVYADVADKRECLEQVLVLDPTNGVARRKMAIVDGRLRQEEIVDPNQIQQAVPAEPQAAQAAQFTCPHCSSRMNYTPDGRSLRCEFCGHQQALFPDDSQVVQAEYGMGEMEQDFAVGLARISGHVQPVAARTLQCQGCGVEFVLTPEILSLTCPYCNHVYVTEVAETQEILPAQALIPFTISAAEVKNNLRAWFQQQKVRRVGLSPIVGAYLPVWTFDLSGELGWKGLVRRGDDWAPASGSYHVMVDDHLVLAQKRPAKYLRQTLNDFDLAGLVAYDARYLADWPAQRYQLALADASLVARRDVLQELRRRPYNLTGGQEVHNLTLNSTGLLVLSYKLVLLPVWMAHYQVEGRTFDLFVNGQNGRVRGEKQGGVVGRLTSWLRGT